MVMLGNILVKYRGNETTVTIPQRVTTIYDGAFAGKTSILEVVFEEESKLNAINADAFKNCSNLAAINFPDGVSFVGEDVMTNTAWLRARQNDEYIKIAKTLIKYNVLDARQIVVPSDIETINKGAFSGARVYDILVGENVKTIRAGAFDNVAVQDVNIADGWTLTLLWTSPLPNQSKTPPTLLLYTVDGNYVAFSAKYVFVQSDDELERFRRLDTWAFLYGEEILKAIDYKRVSFDVDAAKFKPLADVDAYAFYNEIALEELTERYMFAGWFSNGTYTNPLRYPYFIASDMTAYAKYVDRTVGSNPGEYTFKQVGSSPSVFDYTELVGYTYRNDTRIIVAGQHSGTQMLTITGAFAGHDELVEVSFTANSAVATIGTDAFKDCTSLTKIVIPKSVKTIATGAFNGCTALREIIFEDGISGLSIETGAFENCTALTRFTVPSGTVRIETDAFVGCIRLREIYCVSSSAVNLIDSVPFTIYEDLKIYIPKGALDSYLNRWKAYEARYFIQV